MIFGGCIVSAVVDFWGYTTGSSGIGCGLKIVRLEDNVNVTRIDEQLNAEDFFQPVAGGPEPVAQNPAMVAQNQGQAQTAGNGVPSGAPVSQQPVTNDPWSQSTNQAPVTNDPWNQ